MPTTFQVFLSITSRCLILFFRNNSAASSGAASETIVTGEDVIISETRNVLQFNCSREHAFLTISLSVTSPMGMSKQDGLLRNLVFLANSEIMSISITLTVNGVVLAGRLIGYKRYYDGIIKSLSNAKVISDASDEISSKSKDNIIELFEEIKEIATQEKKDELTFMHLEKAVVMNDSSGNLLHPNYWRLKIDSVDGYMIGALEKYA